MVVTQEPTMMHPNKKYSAIKKYIMQRSYINIECNKQNMVETQEPTKLQFIKNTLQKLSK
jgi:hypothetical protein